VLKIDYLEFLETIIKGIPDTINVYNLDCVLEFSNQNTVNCKETFDNTDIKEVIKTKKIIEKEKYLSSSNKFMDICYKPIFNELGEVIFIIERQKDITERVVLGKIQKRSDSNFKNMIDSGPVAVIIVVKGIITFVSEGGKKILCSDFDKIVGKNFYSYIPKDKIKIARHRAKQILKNKIENITGEYKIMTENNKLITLEIMAGYFLYNGSEAVKIEARNISEMQKDINRAAKLQKDGLESNFPIPEKAIMESLYIPLKTISGDFYRIHKVDENYAVGILLDATGKGLGAALNVYALDVLFNEVVEVSKKPLEIIKMLNKKMMDYFEENFIAACCFSFDFKNKQVNVVGAGINELLIQRKGCEVEEVQVKGTPLGMFSNSYFSEKTFTIESGDKFYFFTDGLEFLFDSDKIIQKFMEKSTLKEVKDFLLEYIDDLSLDIEGIKDDCTMIALEIKNDY